MAIVTVFRSRLRPGAEVEYLPVAHEIERVARSMDGFVEMHAYVADDGERVTVVWFSDRQHQAAWAAHPDHRAAQKRGREEFYSWYDITVAEQLDRRSFGS